MGTLVPPWYRPDPPSEHSLDLASFLWGASTAIAIFSFAKAFRQTRRSWLHTHKVNAYIVMVWLEWVACVIMSVISWLFLIGIIPVSFWIFFGLLVLWVVQIQCLSQILCNRLSLLLFNPYHARRLKITAGLAIGLINISVFCIWLPARLQISETFIRLNNIWDRVEKALFLIIDGCLNVYFMHMVRTKLIANGLKKYEMVYKFNLSMMVVSLLLDVLIIALMSWEDDAVYMQAHPLVYLSKLCVEMNLAELLGKVIKKSRERRTRFLRHSSSTSPLTRTTTAATAATTTRTTMPSPILSGGNMFGGCPHFRHLPGSQVDDDGGGDDDDDDNNERLFRRNWRLSMAGAAGDRGGIYTGGELYNYFAHGGPVGGGRRTGDILDDAAGLFSSVESTPAVSPGVERDVEAEGGLGGCLEQRHHGGHRTDGRGKLPEEGREGEGESGAGGGHAGGGDDRPTGSRKTSAGSSTLVAQQEGNGRGGGGGGGGGSGCVQGNDQTEGEDHRRSRHDR
ncbi:hypothetical protein QBC41DRAFT_350630 [Cercophora samala]|uniref:Transmembrane protein n=1 Tax=Cercophora samala TaxID=330535 RepID=A0AA40D4P9_9PEZI|nr:hypothetical protein QBC41DRAFT_350630 [Cercophora samala]